MTSGAVSDGIPKEWLGLDRRKGGDRRNGFDNRSGKDRRGHNVINTRRGADQIKWRQGLFLSQHPHSVSLVIPTLNEAKNLPHVLPLIPAWIYEVIIVDGDSTDGTVQIARKLRPDIRIVKQKGTGKGAALRTGFAAATGDIIVTFDADGSMDPAEISVFVGALLAGAEFVKGSRFIQGGGTDDMEWYRRLGNWVLKLLVGLTFGGNYSDLCYGYNAFFKRTLPLLNLDADGFEIETQMNIRALRSKLKIMEVPSFEAERIHGESYLRTIPDGWRVLKTILKERFGRQTPQASQGMMDLNDSQTSDRAG